MADRPSKRVKHGLDFMSADITPMMNLMVVLIPLLLTSAEFVKLSMVELNLPPAAAGPESEALAQLPDEQNRKLDLTVTITDRGFFISSSMAVLGGVRSGEPSIPLIQGADNNLVHDFNGLSQKLYELKQRAKDRFPDVNQIIILAEPNIVYQTVISTMDAARSVRINDVWEELFPDILLSADIF